VDSIAWTSGPHRAFEQLHRHRVRTSSSPKGSRVARPYFTNGVDTRTEGITHAAVRVNLEDMRLPSPQRNVNHTRSRNFKPDAPATRRRSGSHAALRPHREIRNGKKAAPQRGQLIAKYDSSSGRSCSAGVRMGSLHHALGNQRGAVNQATIAALRPLRT